MILTFPFFTKTSLHTSHTRYYILIKHKSIRTIHFKSKKRMFAHNKRIDKLSYASNLGSAEKQSVSKADTSESKKFDCVEKPIIGVLGGGQLGRMMAIAGFNLGIKVKCMDPNEACAVANLSSDPNTFILGDYNNKNDIMNFANKCDILTVEIEHVNVNALEHLQEYSRVEVHPAYSTLEIIQDKYNQKRFFFDKNIPTAMSSEIMSQSELYMKKRPFMLKARRQAYDGKGNYLIKEDSDIALAVESLGGSLNDLYTEDYVDFIKELSVMVIKDRDGRMDSYPVTETIHKESICYMTITPANVSKGIKEQARYVAESAVNYLTGAGVYGVEMFLTADGNIIINEIAPRPHNSGHYTIDACNTSQFEQHLRAILGWPLGSTQMNQKNAVMLNILGQSTGYTGLSQANELVGRALNIPSVKVHWYDKSGISKNRKIGHVTIMDDYMDKCKEKLEGIDSEALNTLQQTNFNAYNRAFKTLLKIETVFDNIDQAQVSVIMGSKSDLHNMSPAVKILKQFGVKSEIKVVSAHRTPDKMYEFAKMAKERGIKVIIAGAGGAAHLPGMVAAITSIPVIGVPSVPSSQSFLSGVDSLLSIVQMPRGVPVATVAINNAFNAGLLAVEMLALDNIDLYKELQNYKDELKKEVDNMSVDLEEENEDIEG